MVDKSDKETARLFFALWPDGKTRGVLDQAAARLHRRCGGKQTRAETLHLTLVFLGETPLSRIGSLLEAAGKVRAPAFSMSLTRLGWWRHNRIAWAMAEAVPAELAALVGQLRVHLDSAGISFDTKPHVPHVTLLRKAHCSEEAFPPMEVEWRARELVLAWAFSICWFKAAFSSS